MAEWQPIETAPRDGGPVVLYIPYAPEKFSIRDCMDLGYWSKRDNCWRFTGDDGPDDIQPTHWMEPGEFRRGRPTEMNPTP